MRLSRLELFGFKSFLNRTVFSFDQGITAIVGPNGCGKSNVVDAIVWASGERGTKSLRVKDMGDVIFHGSNGKRPVNIAEVTIGLSDNETNYEIKRRIYRDGVNEYYLNGNLVRLKDIQDFFLGTGIGVNSYAIVEQGRIEYFIQMKPHERRVVIEETSGITRFEEKKREAIIRMEEVKSNLERVEDIYREVTTSLEKATVEWERWRKYKALSEKQNRIDSMILIDGYGKIRKRLEKMFEKKEGLEKEILIKEGEIAEIKGRLHSKEEEFALIERVIRELEVEIKGKEKDMENRLVEVEYIEGEIKRLEKEKGGIEKEQERLSQEIERYKEEIKKLEDELTSNTHSLSKGEEEGKELEKALTTLKEKAEEIEQLMEKERVGLFVVANSIAEAKNRLAEMERIERERERRRKKREEDIKRFTERLDALKKRVEYIKETINTEKNEKDSRVLKMDGLYKEKERLGRELEEKRRTLYMLKAEKRGKEEYLKQLTNNRGDLPPKIKEMKKLLDVARIEEGKEKALERFFSREMQYYVVPEGNMDKVGELARKYGENLIFFPEKGIFEQKGDEVEIHVVWITTPEEGFRRVSEGEEGIFLNDEIYIDSRGIVIQERAEKRIDIKKFKEQKRVEEELKAVDERLRNIIAEINTLEAEFNRYDKAYKSIRHEVNLKDENIKKKEKELTLIEAEEKTIKERLSELDSEIDLFEEIDSAEVERLTKERAEKEKEKERLEGRLNFLRGEQEKRRREYGEVSAKWHELTLTLERIRGRMKAISERIERNKETITTYSEEMEKNREKILFTENEMARTKAKRDQVERDYGRLKDQCEKEIKRYEDIKATSGNVHMEKKNLEDQIESVQKEVEKIRAKREGIETEMAVMGEKLETITERLATTYGITNPDGVALDKGVDLEKEREDILKAIGELGDVNFRAEKEYEELKERASFLERQKEDLKEAMEALKKTIIKIDSLSREIFFETFETVNGAFKRFTELLFKGGKGYLSFNQEIAGVEMFVQPPGKRTTRMELLSGGEKTLISLAFLLSLMDTKPSPFSLMDEIDAPLDDANIISLMDIIKGISTRTQIILITHNRITMEASDAIYGVTMEEEGISKVVSVRLK
ncbi:MAG: AAA family ATPase [Syntrophorhabdaceae bacterium]|nr:AAA family ATPase [Syntrophorhabdaceae bacterium]